MSSRDKVAEAMNRSLPELPSNARALVVSMLKPESIAIIAGTLVVWAGSHFFGIGEIVDVILLGVGTAVFGLSVIDGASELYDFANGAINARTNQDLDRAARSFARAVTILGISVVQAVLLRGQGRAVTARGRPQIQLRLKLAAPPPAGNQLSVARPARLPGGNLGETDAYGVIQISRNQSLTEQRLTLFHELVHRYFSPRTGPLRQLRAEVSAYAYARSPMLRYLEEALAEGYGQLRVNGFGKAITALRFPLVGGYVTISELVAEGQTVGSIVLGGTQLRVSVSRGPIPATHD
jgi:hypothetical protein